MIILIYASSPLLKNWDLVKDGMYESVYSLHIDKRWTKTNRKDPYRMDYRGTTQIKVLELV